MADNVLYVNIATGVTLLVGVGGIFAWLRGTHKEVSDSFEKKSKDLDEIIEKRDADVENIQRDIVNIRLQAVAAEANCTRADDVIRNEMGETGHALRTKIHEVEMWTRDKYVSKETFELVTSRIEAAVEKGFTRVEAQVEKAVSRLEKRMDDDNKADRERERSDTSSSRPGHGR